MTMNLSTSPTSKATISSERLVNSNLVQCLASSTNRTVSVEHILEWQVLVDFIRSDMKRCEHLATYFQDPVEVDTTLNFVSGGVTKLENMKTK